MEEKEKLYTKLRLACCFRKILKEKKAVGIRNKEKGVEDLSHVDNLRQLEAASGLSFTLIQTTLAASRDPQFTSVISLIEALNLSFQEFAKVYDNLSDAEIKETRREIEQSKKGS